MLTLTFLNLEADKIIIIKSAYSDRSPNDTWDFFINSNYIRGGYKLQIAGTHIYFKTRPPFEQVD